jgi:uncharacterized 2Fe-2S/4Fe-4S cluster protein (DUF4445 family)
MKTLSITFLPDQKVIEVEGGTTIAEAAQRSGIFINNLCGGEGVCGECRVQVRHGKVQAGERDSAFFSQEEIDSGFVLACQTAVFDELTVEIPADSRLEDEQIVTDEGTAGPDGEGAALTRAIKPLMRKVYLDLPPPTLEDNITDLERISRELRKKLGWHSYDISLPSLQILAENLRENQWKITACVAKKNPGYTIQSIEPLDTTARNFGLAIDLGTTTVVGQLIDLRTGRILAVDGTHNMQAQYGEDVISRMIYACGKGGLSPLREAILENINHLINRLAEKAAIEREDIYAIVAAGNTTMSHFLLGLTPCAIRLEPYVPTADTYPQVLASHLGIQINPMGIFEMLPTVASYVGGDIVAGVLSSGIADHAEVRGLIDIGTNGEIAIGNNEWLVCCSASAGPSFEGGGTRSGMRATRGAIEKVEIGKGQLTYETIGNSAPRGICGSGLIDCIYGLVKHGIIGADGKFDRNRKDPRLGYEDDIPHYIIADSKETDTGEAIVFTESDISNLIKSKGSVYAAIKSLVDYIGLSFDQLDTFYVAGGFGNYLNIPRAIGIGLLPDLPQDRFMFIGNSSLAGARLSLLSGEAFDQCLIISKSMTNIDLSNYQPYMDEYIAALFLPHTDRRLFPSVDY